MKLIEENRLSLKDEVCEYLPAYRDMTVKNGKRIVKAKKKITIRDLMTMTAGLDYDINSPSIKKIIEDTGGKAGTREVVEAMAIEPLSFEPGTRYQYSLCHDVLAAVIEVITGRLFSGYLAKIIFDPLNMKDSKLKADEKDYLRLSPMYTYDPKNMTSEKIPQKNYFLITENYESGGAGLVSSVNDMIKFTDALSDGKERVISTDSIQRMSRNELKGKPLEDFKTLGKKGYGYGLGVRTLIDKSSSRSPIGEFGWDGAAGSYALIDPKSGLSIFYAQHVMGCAYAYDRVHPEIRDMVYEIAGLG